jgi:serine-type D-Ala-D-Ala carboxypeptidase (penicillin-binding protein 5/6)
LLAALVLLSACTRAAAGAGSGGNGGSPASTGAAEIAAETGAVPSGGSSATVGASTKAWQPPPGAPAAPRVGAPSVIVENLDTGTVMFATHAHRRRPIASLTKIMTALVVLERTTPTDVVTVSRWAASQRPTKLGLPPGAQMDVRDLLYALLLMSANDVAVALAEHVSGSTSAFDALMSRTGRELGMTDTRFASPSGLNDWGYSTASDVAAMARAAAQVPALATIVATRLHTITLPPGKRVQLWNLNDLLFGYPGAIGMKTGFTDVSHWSLVGVARRDDLRLLVVLLGDHDKPFDDGAALLDWGFRVAAAAQDATEASATRSGRGRIAG